MNIRKKVVQLAGFNINIIGLLCVLATTFVPDWRKSNSSGSLIEAATRNQGIWVRCVNYPTGQTHCDAWSTSFVGLPSIIRIARGLCVAAVILTFIGFILSFIGLQITNCCRGRPTLTSLTSLFGAICFGVAGLIIVAAVTHYSNQVLDEYNREIALFGDEYQPRFTTGVCISIGYAACAILVFGSLVAGVGSMMTDKDAYIKKSRYANTVYVHRHIQGIVQECST